MPIVIENRRTAKATLLSRHSNPVIIDSTSQGSLPYRKLSPFYPHGNIPIPFSPSQYASSVEGIWQGLKVFEHAGIDSAKFHIDNMKGIKRNNKSLGAILGHRKGIDSNDILDYVTAKREIYIPSYLWVIQHCLQKEMSELAAIASVSVLVLLDYNTATDPLDANKPISHASLCKTYLDGEWKRLLL